MKLLLPWMDEQPRQRRATDAQYERWCSAMRALYSPVHAKWWDTTGEGLGQWWSHEEMCSALLDGMPCEAELP